MLKDYMTPQEVADFRGMSIHALAIERSRGKGPRTFKIGRRVYYATKDLLDFMEKHRRAAEAVD